MVITLLGVGAALIEIFVFRYGGGNIFVCSLFVQVIAYWIIDFCCVPAQSHLLFGTIIFNVLLIYFADKAMGCWRARFAS